MVDELVTMIECQVCHKPIRASRPHDCITQEKDC